MLPDPRGTPQPAYPPDAGALHPCNSKRASTCIGSAGFPDGPASRSTTCRHCANGQEIGSQLPDAVPPYDVPRGRPEVSSAVVSLPAMLVSSNRGTTLRKVTKNDRSLGTLRKHPGLTLYFAPWDALSRPVASHRDPRGVQSGDLSKCGEVPACNVQECPLSNNPLRTAHTTISCVDLAPSLSRMP